MAKLASYLNTIFKGFVAVTKRIIGPAYSILDERRKLETFQATLSDDLYWVDARDFEEQRARNNGEIDKEIQPQPWDTDISRMHKKQIIEHRKLIREECKTIEEMLRNIKTNATQNIRAYGSVLRAKAKNEVFGHHSLIVAALEELIGQDATDQISRECTD